MACSRRALGFFVDGLMLSSMLVYFEMALEFRRLWASRQSRVVSLSAFCCLVLNAGLVGAGWTLGELGLFG